MRKSVLMFGPAGDRLGLLHGRKSAKFQVKLDDTSAQFTTASGRWENISCDWVVDFTRFLCCRSQSLDWWLRG
jgi:hypothetical protein